MADRTGIEWTDATWNPIVGCSVVSPGCTNCYAMKMAARIEAMQPGTHYSGTTQASKAGAVWTGKLALAPDSILTQPLRWRRPRKIFVNSMGDLFHEDAPDAWIDRVFAVMALTPQHTYQVLTKRSARMRAYFSDPKQSARIVIAMGEIIIASQGAEHGPYQGEAARLAAFRMRALDIIGPSGNLPLVLPNVWLGVSSEDQRRADERVPDLLATPAAIRFVSAEPLLGPLDLTRVGTMASIRAAMPGLIEREERGRPREGNGSVSGFQIEAVGLAGSSIEYFQTPDHMGGFSAATPRRFDRLDLVIVGGENGPRPMHPDWARSLRDQCAAAGAAFFFKQWGSWEVAVDRERDDPDWRLDYHRKFVDAGATKWLNLDGGCGFHGERFHVMRRVGKRAAGRLLDGVEHNAMPEVRA